MTISDADELTPGPTVPELERAAEAIDPRTEEPRRRIAAKQYDYESYHALFEIYREGGRTDAALCMAKALDFIAKANPDETEWIERHGRAGLAKVRRRMSEALLHAHVCDPEQDLALTAVLGTVCPAVAAWRATVPSREVERPSGLLGFLHALGAMFGGARASYEPRPSSQQVDIATHPTMVSRVALYVTQVLGVVKPEVYLCPEHPGDLRVLNVERDARLSPTMEVLGRLLRGKSESDLVFALGRGMMDLHLPYFCFVALDRSPAAVEQVLDACAWEEGASSEGDDSATLEQVHREIFGRLQPAAQDRLREQLQRFEASEDPLDVERWARAAERTACRVGLLLCGDLRIAAQMISQEEPRLGPSMAMSPRDKIAGLVLYSISEDYFAARRALGLAVG